MNSINSNTMTYQKTNLALSEVEWANQTQNKPNSNPIAERPKMNANIYYTIDYNNEPAVRRIQNKPKQTHSKFERKNSWPKAELPV